MLVPPVKMRVGGVLSENGIWVGLLVLPLVVVVVVVFEGAGVGWISRWVVFQDGDCTGRIVVGDIVVGFHISSTT